jgi:glycosyltransferase involved in cell wall biosynthesis
MRDDLMTRPSLLYISPVIPAMTGNGLAMRAGVVLEVLAASHDVRLLVAPLYASVTPEIPEPLEKLCRQTAIVSPWRQPTGRQCRNVRFDVVHVFRIASLPFAKAYLRQGLLYRPWRHLDLDDIESETGRRLAALYRQNGDMASADQQYSAAASQESVENEAFRHFDRIYVCSALDREKLRGRTRVEIRVLPNVVRMPAAVPGRSASGLFTFLFVGTLGYYPNEDAVRYLCAKIVPRIAELCSVPFVVNIVGTGGSGSLQQAANAPPVRYIGTVADLQPWYEQADVVLAPVRAGGGTRIKILEAFSYQRPVVATSIAMEGIEAAPGEHMLIGDTAAEFATQCARLIADRELCGRLARNAFELVRDSYTVESLIAKAR